MRPLSFRIRPSCPLVPIFCVLACLLWVPPAAAVTVDGLYRAEIKVPDKSADARAAAFRTALERVLVKVSGNSTVATLPKVRGLLESPASLVERFRYRRIEAPRPEPARREDQRGGRRETLEAGAAGPGDGVSGDAGSSAADEAGRRPRYRLSIKFAEALINRALRERGIGVWDNQRPEVLVWLAVDNGRQRMIVASGDDTAAHDLLVRHARHRALPILLPLMDMSDRARVGFLDIQGGFLGAIRSASKRYRVTTVLVGHVYRRGGKWRGDWTLMGMGERKSWRSTATDLEGAIDGGVDGAADRLAAALAGRTGKTRELRLRVVGVESLDDYARVSAYLADLVRVRSAEIAQVRPHEAIFRVRMQGQLVHLKRSILLGTTLAPIRPRPDRTGADSERGESGRIGAIPGDAAASGPRAPADMSFRLIGPRSG